MIPPPPNVLQDDLTLLLPPVPVSAETAHSPWVYAAAAGATLGAAALVWWWRRRHRIAPALAEPAETIALRELARWRSLPQDADLRVAVSAVSDTLRRYVNNRFGFGAPTMTSEEFQAEQASRHLLPPGHDRFWTPFLQSADAIKYAGYEPAAEQFMAMLDRAQTYVQRSDPATATPPSTTNSAP